MYKLVYNGGFSNFELEFKLCGPNLCGLSYKVKSTIHFHNKIFHSYFGYIYHHTPMALLLYCDNIKDWSIGCKQNRM